MRNSLHIHLALGMMVLAALPNIAFAATTLFSVFCTIATLIDLATPIIVALALAGFFWGLAMYILNFNLEEKEKKKGRDIMVYGVITFTVMLSIWGIVNMIQATFGINNGTIIPPTFEGVPAPQFETQSC